MMVRAATSGIIDFSKADPYDKQWMANLRLALAETSRRSQLDFVKVLHQHYVGMLAIDRLEDASFRKLRDRANELLDVIIQLQEPWNDDQVAAARKDQVKAAVQEWEDHYGSLSDPAVQAGIDETVEAVRKHRAEYEIRRQVQEEIWRGRRKGTRRERYAKRNRNVRRD